MEYIIGIILIIIVVIIVALLYRKRLYNKVDDYESWKINIMNRNIPAEIAQIKGVESHGDLKISINVWKSQWEHIIQNNMADVEELLYDVEKLLDHFRFSSAKKLLQQIDAILLESEKEISMISDEINDFASIEDRVKKEENKVRPELQQLRKQLSQNSYQYDLAEIRFEVELDELESQLDEYVIEIQSGNYNQAKEQLELIRERSGELKKEIEAFPAIYQKCKKDLPKQLTNVLKGLTEMKEDGYRLDHLNFPEEISHYQTQLLDCVNQLEKKGTENIEEAVIEIEERIKEMFDQLESEALAKNYVEGKLPAFETSLLSFQEEFEETRQEMEEMKKAYFLEDNDIEKFMNIDKKLSQTIETLENTIEKNKHDAHAHSILRKDVEAAFERLHELDQEHSSLKERVKNIRKDELDAKELLENMVTRVYQTYRQIKNSNLPGVPTFIWTLMDEAKDKNEAVLSILEEKPLDISKVQKSLKEAKNSVELAIENTETMIEQAQLTEQVIQYANRYRSSYPVLAANLVESERLFHAGEYELSLEKAANAVEQVEPGALKRIEKFQAISV